MRYNPPMLIPRPSALFSRRDKPYGAAGGIHRPPLQSWASVSLFAPLASILVFVIVMTAIVWSLNRREQQYQEDTLYRNAAWAQQQISVSLGDLQDRTSGLAAALARGGDAAAVAARFADMRHAHPEVIASAWLDANGTQLVSDAAARIEVSLQSPASAVSAPFTASATATGSAARAASNATPAAAGASSNASGAAAPRPAAVSSSAGAPASAARAQSADSGTALPLPAVPARLPNAAQRDTMLRAGLKTPHVDLPSYSEILFDEAGHGYLTLQTPVMRGSQRTGSVATLISVDGMLVHQLPRELTTKFKISLLTADGRELSTTSTRPRLPRDPFSELKLEPPGNGLVVRVYTYPHVGSLTNNTLIWLVAGLSCLVLWSLLSLWKYTRERAAAQQALYAETSFRRAMENSVSLGMRVLDMEGRITHVNPAFCRMTGWDESDLLDHTAPFAYWPPDSYPEMHRQYDMTLRGKVPATGFEMRVRRKNGSIFHARMYISPLIDSSGKQTGWMGSMTDISEPRRVREELSAAHERFTTVLESLDAAVSVLASNEAELLFANRYYRNLFGVRADGHLALAGSGFDAHQASSDSIDLVDTFAGLPTSALTDSSADTIEVYVERVEKWFEVRRQYIQWVDGHLAQMQIATDITVRKAAQELALRQDEKLRFTSRLTTMGEMASSLAHELNQPLAAISNYCAGASALVKSGRAAEPMLLQALEKTSQQALRAGMIIKRIRAFVKRSEPKREPAALDEIIADAVGLAEIEIRRFGISVVVDLDGPLPQVWVDRVLIEQVLVNLLKNAAEAMHALPARKDPSWGRIVVDVTLEEDMACVAVRDQGPGIDETQAERLFEPFFSTKSDGMGMGLNICRSIIESHRGRLWASNQYGPDDTVTGCVFHFTLPLGREATGADDA